VIVDSAPASPDHCPLRVMLSLRRATGDPDFPLTAS
jgi:hypothetical protein